MKIKHLGWIIDSARFDGQTNYVTLRWQASARLKWHPFQIHDRIYGYGKTREAAILDCKAIRRFP